MNVEQLVVPAGGFLAVLWVLVKLIVGQFEKRLDEKFLAINVKSDHSQAHWDKRFSEQDDALRELDRQVVQQAKDLPLHYVRREDWIRETAVMHAKLDGLAAKLELLLMRKHSDGD